jgi:beta-lactamase class A
MIDRRQLLGGTAATFLIAAAVCAAPKSSDSAKSADTVGEQSLPGGGRLGFCVLDTSNGEMMGSRTDERFAMCSTFKLPLAAAILQAADRGNLKLDQWVSYSKADMVPYAPVTGKNLEKGGMTVLALAEAAQKFSDNPAANLLMKLIGGPAGLTTILREWGDDMTRIDRTEPEMNRVLVGDARDTTTPRAMAKTMQHFLLGDVLSPTSRELLISWMIATETGAKRIRAGLPGDWRAGDKTGTANGSHVTNKYNDVAIAWPPGKAPFIITSYYDTAIRTEDMRDEDQAVLAEVGRIAARWAMGRV